MADTSPLAETAQPAIPAPLYGESLIREGLPVVIEMPDNQVHLGILVQEDAFGAEVVVRSLVGIRPGTRLALRYDNRCDPAVVRSTQQTGHTTWLDVQWNWPLM